MADDKSSRIGDINLTLGDNNQVGNVGHKVTVNQAPAPQLRDLGGSLRQEGSKFIKTSMVEIVSPYPPPVFGVTTSSPALLDFEIVPDREGQMSGSRGKNPDGSIYQSVNQPSGRYTLIVTLSDPNAHVECRYHFK